MSQEVICLKFRAYLTVRNVIHVDRLPLDVTNYEEVYFLSFKCFIVDDILLFKCKNKNPRVGL